jgi:hypothetical protein
MKRRPIFILKIEGKPGAAGIHGLRAVLKVLLRKYGFKCLDAHEIPDRETIDDDRPRGGTAHPTEMNHDQDR